MLQASITASAIALCLAIFFGANLLNLFRFWRKPQDSVRKAEVDHPAGLLYALSAFCTLLFFMESAVYVLLVLLNTHSIFTDSMLLHFPYDTYVQIFGLVTLVSGFLLFTWSVLARGRFASSWEMREDHKLVTWGPYKFVRHPSYLAYILLFIGLPLALLNLLTLLPLLGIPGYVRIADIEERLLTARFGDEYARYQKATGKLFPRLRGIRLRKTTKFSA